MRSPIETALGLAAINDNQGAVAVMLDLVDLAFSGWRVPPQA
jgi:hypothetical protein